MKGGVQEKLCDQREVHIPGFSERQCEGEDENS